MRIFSANPIRHKTSHGQAGDSPVFPICNCIVIAVDIINEFRVIDWKLPVSFYRAHIVWTHIIFFIRASVISVGLHYNNFMSGNKICNIVALVFIPFIKIRITVTASEIPLGPAMEKIDDRIFFWWIIKIARGQEYTIVSCLSEYTAIMLRINNGYFACMLSIGVKGER